MLNKRNAGKSSYSPYTTGLRGKKGRSKAGLDALPNRPKVWLTVGRKHSGMMNCLYKTLGKCPSCHPCLTLGEKRRRELAAPWKGVRESTVVQ